VQIPTTLLAQVDSSVGGKTAINTIAGKNLLGAFYQPRLVLADTGALATLPHREMLAGYAEMVKYGLIADAQFFDWLDAEGGKVCEREPAALTHAVVISCRMKAEIVAGDERETGDSRALLNFGHTFGHALEAETGFSDALLHGEAVALGMVLAFDFAVRHGVASGQDATRVRRHIAAIGLPTELGAVGLAHKADHLLAHMAKDKKVRDGRITLILPRRIGDAYVMRNAETEDLRAFLVDAA
jgi:3-dehydroquinate synthase